jgi:addiction module RelE/StbE family toxin
MKNNIHYSQESLSDLDEVWIYIAADLDNESAANRMVLRIVDTEDKLEEFPEMGAMLSTVADIVSDYRFLVCENYLVLYRVTGNDVYVDRILYGKRDYLRVLFGDSIQDATNERK